MRPIKLIKKWINAINNYDHLVDEFADLAIVNRDYQIELSKLLPSEIETYWLSKHQKKFINYERTETDGKHFIDVRSFFMPNYRYPKLKGKSHDETALKCLKWVIKNIRYVADASIYGFTEYWAFAYQTLKWKKGDCEDGAVLLANMLIHNGVPFWRVRINAGWVKLPRSKDKVGHAYLTYCRESDDQWVVLDWCYYTSTKKISERSLHKDKRRYYSIWWSADKEQAYGNKRYMADMPEKFKGG